MFKVFNARVDMEEMRRAMIRMGYPMALSVGNINDDTRFIDDLLPVAKRLGNAPGGLGHDKFLRQIPVSFDVLAERFWWAQFDTYGIFTVKNSQSTMHKGKSLDYDKLADKYVDKDILDIFKRIVQEYNTQPTQENFMRVKANLPEGICIAAGITTNYAQLKTIYTQRWNHRLPQWREFCKFIASLPYAMELGICTPKENEA